MKQGEPHHMVEAWRLLQQVNASTLQASARAATAHNLAVWHEQRGLMELTSAADRAAAAAATEAKRCSAQVVDASAGAQQALLQHAASLCLYARLTSSPSEAQEQYAAAIPLWQQALGPQHPVLAVTQANLAHLLSSGSRDDRSRADELHQNAVDSLAGPSTKHQDSSLATLLLQAQQELEAAETSSSSSNSSNSKLLRWMPDQDSSEYKQTVAQISSLSKLLQGRGPHDLPFINASTLDISLTQMRQLARLPVTIEFTTGKMWYSWQCAAVLVVLFCYGDEVLDSVWHCSTD
jgi:hypothetical protein